MEKNQTKRVIVGLLIILIIVGIALCYLLFFRPPDQGSVKEPTAVEQKDTESTAVQQTDIRMEKKIENINQSDEAYLKKRYGKIDTLFSDCDSGLERKAITDRLLCIRKDPKAEKFWRDMQTAEKELKLMLLKNDIQALSKYLSCDAYDLTWYEMHCESDRILVQVDHVGHLLRFLRKSGSTRIQDAVWQQRTPNKRLYRNPRWLLRSRLVNPQFKLIGPWQTSPHPTESGTLIMLEQHLDGKIYIVGIPITGTYDES